MAIPGLAAILAVTLYILETTQVHIYCMHLDHPPHWGGPSISIFRKWNQIALSAEIWLKEHLRLLFRSMTWPRFRERKMVTRYLRKILRNSWGLSCFNLHYRSFSNVLVSVLEQIAKFMESQVGLGLRYRVLNRRNIEASINEHTRLLNDAWMTFHVGWKFSSTQAHVSPICSFTSVISDGIADQHSTQNSSSEGCSFSGKQHRRWSKLTLITFYGALDRPPGSTAFSARVMYT